MIEVQFIRGTTDHTLSAVALPDLELNSRWDYPTPHNFSRNGSQKIFIVFYRL
jgi:hypothetical protein